MNQIPTLVIGIGGVGCRIAASISSRLNNEKRRLVGVIGIDTDTNELAHFSEKINMKLIQISDRRRAEEYLEDNPQFKEWFPDNDYIRGRTMQEGAGQIRALSRLATAAAEMAGKFDPIKQEIIRIRRNDGDEYNNKLAVIITGSMCGGTGAGLFLQLPFYIRKLVRTEMGMDNIVIRGMFLGPDILIHEQRSRNQQKAIYVNAYSCMKELNNFYQCLHPMYSRETNNLRLEFYEPKDRSPLNVPYDYVFLMESSGNQGTNGGERLPAVIRYTSEILYTILFSPLGDAERSVIDNFIIETIEQGGLNRFAGAGICKLVYPVGKVRDYVTKAIVRNTVKDEWLLLDDKFEVDAKVADEMNRSDGVTKIPELKENYCTNFKEYVLDSKKSAIKFLREEAYYKDDNYNVFPNSKKFEAVFNTTIREFINDKNKKKREMAEACAVKSNKMTLFSDAESEVNRVWNAMTAYAEYAESQVNEKPMQFANKLFPVSRKLMKTREEEDTCIYKYLVGVHPVTARFFIYNWIKFFEGIIKESEAKLNRVSTDAYLNFDYYREGDKDDNKENPRAALNIIKEKRNPFMRRFGNDETALSGLTSDLQRQSGNHVKQVNSYLENSLKKITAELLLERLTELADNYTKFFTTIKDNVQKNEQALKDLQNMTFLYGEDGLYCSADALNRIERDYSTKNHYVLSAETKKAVFDELFGILADNFSAAKNGESERELDKRVKEAERAMAQVFRTAVVGTVRKEVIRKGNETVNLSAREALSKEYALENTSPDISESDYIRMRISRALNVAQPSFSAAPRNNYTELIFLAVSGRSALKDHDDENKTISDTAAYYLTNTNDRTTVIVDSAFNDNEIVCLRLTYNYTLDELTQYKPGARAETEYRERIRNYLAAQNRHEKTMTLDRALVTVNPHLNCYWHEEGFLRAIESKCQKQAHIDHIKAFFYGLGMDYFRLLGDENRPDPNGKPRLTWCVYFPGTAGFAKITKCGKIIGNTFNDLFDSIPFNGVIKSKVLNCKEVEIESMTDVATSEELYDDIFNNSFIKDLCLFESDADQYKDMNIFDILLEMRNLNMDKDVWEEMFVVLQQVLWEFCAKLFSGNEQQVNDATRMILTEIFNNCSVGRSGGKKVAAVKKKSGEKTGVTVKKSGERSNSSINAQSLKKLYENLLSNYYTYDPGNEERSL